MAYSATGSAESRVSSWISQTFRGDRWLMVMYNILEDASFWLAVLRSGE